MEEIIVFIEKVDSKIGYLLLDFPPKSEKGDLKSQFFNQLNLNVGDSVSSMLEISNASFKKGGIPREGSFYHLPQEFFNFDIWTFSAQSGDNNQASYIAFSASGDNLPELSFGPALHNDNNSIFLKDVKDIKKDAQRENLDNPLYRIDQLIDQKNKVKIVVKDVSQGNFNIVHFAPLSFIIYDIGSMSSTRINQGANKFFLRYLRLAKLKKLRKCSPNIQSRVLIISHWDIDHYNGLLDLSDEYLDFIDLFIIPEKLVNDTSRRAYERIQNRNVSKVIMRPRVLPHQEATRLESIYHNNLINIYRGSKSCNRNKSGILLSVHNNIYDAILPADHSYEQLNNYLFGGCTLENGFLVAPHHGGHAGYPTLINNWKALNEVAISVGANPWGHPYQYVLDALFAKVGRHQVKRTDQVGEIVKTLA